MSFWTKLKNLFTPKMEETMSRLVEKGRKSFRSFAPIYDKKGQHLATVGHLTYNCDVVSNKGNVLGQVEKIYRMYKPSQKSILGKMGVYEVTTSKTLYGKKFESATILTGKDLTYTTITDKNEFKGFVRAMKINSGAMKV